MSVGQFEGMDTAMLFTAAPQLAKSPPAADVAARVGEHGTGSWRFVRHYVDEAGPCEGWVLVVVATPVIWPDF